MFLHRDINKKREDYLCWTDYFMATAFLAAKRSKDPRTQVGACIVNEDNRIVGVGYNDMPRGCSGDQFSWDRGGDIILETKQLYGKRQARCHLMFGISVEWQKLMQTLKLWYHVVMPRESKCLCTLCELILRFHLSKTLNETTKTLEMASS
jgi:deoxycytidylate deaminase